MARQYADRDLSANSWWLRNHLLPVRFPQLPTKKELIYRIFRAAYPNGAFINDNLQLQELRDKNIVWEELEKQIQDAARDLDAFAAHLQRGVRGLRQGGAALGFAREYFAHLLSEARAALLASQNGRFFEFRAMEELLVRYRAANGEAWARLPPGAGLPTTAGLTFAVEHLEFAQASGARALQGRLLEYDATHPGH
ncbi:hypothetical protein F4804DRAFT_145446 [Jackrogersella minutella]|nr:hypothetical protein F4804DRAFT_145446 [Jackrogersella minutella]